MGGDGKNMTLEAVRDYYGRALRTNRDLRTKTCCAGDSLPEGIRGILKEVHPEVAEKFYGCGSPIPYAITGKTVLDLGSGSGRDCFILSKLVGPEGRVIGVDMTDSQLETARKHAAYQMKKFGFSKPNVEFLRGYIEDLEGLGLADGSVDVVVSNCVLNLSPAKEKVFSEIFRVLRPGGELYFSDVFSGRRIPEHLAQDPVLLGECLGGALYAEDFRRMLAKAGCKDHRTVAKTRIQLADAEIERKAGMIDFYSITVRAFKLDLEDRCEDYGQVAYYLGAIPGCEHAFTLDDHHEFQTGRPVPVCRNTASMLADTRYAPYFKIVGDANTHYGLFTCAPKGAGGPGGEAGGACC